MWKSSDKCILKCYLGDLGMEVLHVLAEHLTKLAQHFFVPGVILQVHLGLDLCSGTDTNVNACLKIKVKSIKKQPLYVIHSYR